MDNFGLPELVAALRARIEADTDLLAKVAQFAVADDSKQPLSDLDDWTPVDAIEEKSQGKLRTTQIRWIARNRDTNGTAEAFMIIGRRLYGNIPLLIRLLSAQQKGGGHAR